MVFVNALATELSGQRNFLTGFIFLILVVVSVRTLTYFFDFPFDFRKLDLFDPSVYASSALHPSLGDLLINAILLFWLAGFIKANSHRFQRALETASMPFKKIAGVAALFILPLFTINSAIFFSSLVKDSADSQLSFNVTDIASLNSYTAVSFMIICLLVLSFFYISQLLVNLSLQLQLTMYWRTAILLSFSLLFLSFKITDNGDVKIGFALIAWLLVFYFFVSLRKADITESFYDSPYFMPWSIFLMASVTVLLMFQNQSLELAKRKSIAYKISRQTDPADERIISMAITKFSDYFLRDNFSGFYSENSNRLLKGNIINSNFRGYLKNFDARIYTYDSSFNPLFNEDSTSYRDIKAIVVNEGIPANKEGLYFYEKAADQFIYIYEKDVQVNENGLTGYVFLVIRPKVYNKEELKPQLIRKLIPDNESSGSDYPYAVYNKNLLVKSSGNYNFMDTVYKKDLPKFESEFKDNNGYSELWYNTTGNKLIIIARKDNWFAESVAFFAYLFGIFIILVLIQHFGHLIFKTRFNWAEIKKIFRFNIRTQIQTIIVSVTFISFVVIGVVTIQFFVTSFNSGNEQKLRSNTRIMVNEIERLAKDRVVYSDMFNLSNLDLNLELEKQIVQIAETHNTDINFFDVSGNLQVSSQRYIYDNRILSNKMNAVAYDAMHYQRNTQFMQKEKVVDFTYLSIYEPIKNEDGSTLAYLNVPFINSEDQLSQEISSFLVTLINLNALIFILAGAIAIWVTSHITSSFTLIANKMKAINFNSVNEEIEWKKDDELGELVTEYNKMVKKLANSAKALARSEREGAWREMAQQVAHEIKNPLTPMKLSIQYLQKAIDNNMPNVKELSGKVAATLVEQIDQLSNIASDFSQFANITNVKKEMFDLSATLSSIVQLYQADARIEIIHKKEEGNYIIEADKMQMNRLFTNLIKNAIEAYPDDKKATIIIRQLIKKSEVLISVEDRGEGIPAAMQPKIFAPNFTTKTSGTGLGLAICKGIVEKAGGQIWFQTEHGNGTIFFVSLPSVKQQNI
ncbi:MAG TPA: HAMP domain-containing sensor histidine kinase [Panacibacter sp.]|nr:HAMP domain-containing sensor histidine kinase [Panacibacter sp.]